ncbi:MAG: D-xylose ABC transporter ATP-binding protein [Actinobacteria bacterium 13_1_20CM_2_65_11]|nr:MAG: D-xylose ABC transporter ATP-binding protein [Chloroflexi bacterium 13_1_40CM_65_17]OLC68037.1 MAG: D-xylose ABC transporter ATP-binding protein [Actinobacteria bacterium 13_1_40CM_4_65_12]OLE77939.1 MAG: D-xylose ABC transporter ATP-binding protein [Actinobacteria bacterium 13_1_20CM_2_65_11]
MSETSPILQLTGISKRFGAVQALLDVDLGLLAGEVHALVGENGAGKSTLVKILAGIHRPDAGEMTLNGRELVLSGPAAARQLGIAVIHQHPNLFPDLTVAENVFVGRLPRNRVRGVDWSELNRTAERLFQNLGVKQSVSVPVRGLSVADQQLVEIAKALSLDARVLVMDEPTASLSSHEVERLFTIIRQLRSRGVAILFVDHRMEEVFEIADRLSVLRDGRHVITALISELTPADAIRHMVGRRLETLFPKEPATIGEVALEVRGLTRAGVFSDASFEVRRGEILGLAGLVGAGRTEIARVLFGIDKADAGEVLVAGKHVDIKSPRDAMRLGIVYVPEDRHEQGLVLDFSIAANVSLPIVQKLSRFLVVDRAQEERLADEYSKQLQVRSTGVEQAASALSGGNQQKVVIAKWLATEPTVLLLDEPTQGVDIGAKAEVHRIISQLAGQGMAIVLISSELPEVLGMADRIVVLHEGRIAAEFGRDDASQERIMAAATGHVDA